MATFNVSDSCSGSGWVVAIDWYFRSFRSAVPSSAGLPQMMTLIPSGYELANMSVTVTYQIIHMLACLGI